MRCQRGILTYDGLLSCEEFVCRHYLYERMNFYLAMVQFLVYIVFLVCTILASEVTVIRQPLCNIDSNVYCSSTDTFSNQDSTPSACIERNATCTSNECNKCQCKLNDIFLSYEHGCNKAKQVKEALNAHSCFGYNVKGNSPEIPAATVKAFGLYACRYIYNTKLFKDHVQKCAIKKMYTINIFTGEKEGLESNIFALDQPHVNFDFCLKCKDDTCNLDELFGQLVYIEISCKDIHLIRTIQTCFIFKMEGETSRNVTRKEVKSVLPPSDSNFTIIIIPVVIVIILCSIITCLLVYYKRRKKRVNSPKSDPIATNEELLFIQEKGIYEEPGTISKLLPYNPTYEYASISTINHKTESHKVTQDASNIYQELKEANCRDILEENKDEPHPNNSEDALLLKKDQMRQSLKQYRTSAQQKPEYAKVIKKNSLGHLIDSNEQEDIVENDDNELRLNVRKEGYDEVGTIISDNAFNKEQIVQLPTLSGSGLPTVLSSNGYDVVGSVIDSGEIA